MPQTQKFGQAPNRELFRPDREQNVSDSDEITPGREHIAPGLNEIAPNREQRGANPQACLRRPSLPCRSDFSPTLRLGQAGLSD